MSSTPTNGITLGNKTYDRAKFLVQIVLPAIGVLYASLSEFWGLPKVQEVVGTIAALALFLGVVLRISSSNFEPEPTEGTPVGEIVITEKPEGGKTVRMDLDRDPEDFVGQDSIAFKVVKETQSVVEDLDDVRDENVP